VAEHGYQNHSGDGKHAEADPAGGDQSKGGEVGGPRGADVTLAVGDL